MPAARQASRSSAKALAVSAMIGVRGGSPLGLGGADAPRGFEPVHARHLHVHQDEIVGRAGLARGVPALQRRGAALGNGRPVAEPRQQRARQQRVDLVVLGDQDIEQALARRRTVLRAAEGARFGGGRAVEGGAATSWALSEAARMGFTR